MALVGVVTVTPETAPVFVGVGLVAFGVTLLWARRDLYLAYQWVIRYPDHGFVYIVVQYVGPVALILGGIALIVGPLVSK